VLKNLGSTHAWVVHGGDGLDELTTTTVSHVCELKNGAIRRFEISPSELGLETAGAADIRGGDPEQNAAAIRALFDGETGPYRDIVLLNAGAALVVADKTTDIKAGMKLAAEAVDFAKARQVLENLIRFTNQAKAPA
ncbi:MAG TPA: anthranilate phosphoribosyltransferase, partial [Alphaproteobacteria bacterium]|nr:anthranilate phosphoribosyltransferase [Alphaproteobacteria bacterium]